MWTKIIRCLIIPFDCKQIDGFGILIRLIWYKLNEIDILLAKGKAIRNRSMIKINKFMNGGDFLKLEMEWGVERILNTLGSILFDGFLVIHVGRIVTVQLFSPNLYQSIECPATVFYVFLRRPRVVSWTLFSAKREWKEWISESWGKKNEFFMTFVSCWSFELTLAPVWCTHRIRWYFFRSRFVSGAYRVPLHRFRIPAIVCRPSWLTVRMNQARRHVRDRVSQLVASHRTILMPNWATSIV